MCTVVVKINFEHNLLSNETNILLKLYGLLTERKVKMSGYWPNFFFSVNGPRRSQKERGQ